MTAWISIVVTVVLGAVGLYLGHSIRRQLHARVAEKRFDAYGALWAELKVASPLRRVTGEGPLSAKERRVLYGRLTDWYYAAGNGMLLSEDTRNIYLAAKENLICAPKALRPGSLRAQVKAADDSEAARGWASIRQFSLLRTAMRGDIAIYTSPWGQELKQDDREFLAACGVDLGRQPWRTSARGSAPS